MAGHRGAEPGAVFLRHRGVLVYLPEEQVTRALAGIAARFPGARLALDTYPRLTYDRQHRLAAKRNIPARWAWACDDPHSLGRLGLKVLESATITRPPAALLRQLPARYRFLVPLANPLIGKTMSFTLFRAETSLPTQCATDSGVTWSVSGAAVPLSTFALRAVSAWPQLKLSKEVFRETCQNSSFESSVSKHGFRRTFSRRRH